MERSRFGRFLDNIALAFLVFTLVFLVAKTYIKNTLTCLILSLIILFIFVKIFLYFQNKKYTKLGLKRQEQKQIDLLNIYLRGLQKNKQNQYIISLFSDEFQCIKNHFILLNNNTAILNKISKNFVSDEEVYFIISQLNFLKKNHISEVSIFCTKNQATTSINASLFPEINIFFVTPDTLFAIAKNKNKIPLEIKKTQKASKISANSMLFCRKQAKNMLKIAFLLFIFSLILPFSKHYLYVGFLSLILSLFLFIFGKQPKENTNSKLITNIKQ